ncbi:hypothetical protein MKX08_008989 [Trichoderma sp. CBMAI-0020]|nr:hypothetical protein MKX08_008989 [Trichoderma sp. CBMAI-0020]
MVGAAQYQDNEIEWVLSAVVTKKKQSYIQTHFKEKFGRELNHNQIRYIKNKYGKDPRFNSPLVNIHAPPRVTTPEPEGSSEHGDVDTHKNGAAFGNQNQAGPSVTTEEAQIGPEDNGTKSTQPKRKRSRHEQGDALERLTGHTTKSQRLNSSLQQGATSGSIPLSRQQKTSDIRLPTAHTHAHPISMPQASLGDSDHTPLYAGMFQGFQHPQNFPLLHSTNTGITWGPSMFMHNHSWDAARNTMAFTGISGTADSSAITQASPSPMMEHQSMGYTMFQSPTADQYQFQQPYSQLGGQQVSQFSPATPSLSSPPYAGDQEQHRHMLHQEQQLYSHTDVGTIPTLPGSEISNLDNAPYLQNLSGVAPQLIPSFQEVPIESTCPVHGTKQLNLADMESGTNWAHTTTPLNSSPQDPPLFNFTTSPIRFPFESVIQTDLTAASSQAIRQTLHNNATMYNSSLPTQGKHRHSLQSGQQHFSFDASSFDLLSMAQTPSLNTTTAMPYAQPSYPVNNTTMAFSPLMAQAGYRPRSFHRRSTPGPHVCAVHGTVNDMSGTIDPRLLATNSASPQPHTSMSSPLDEAKRGKEAPTKSLSSKAV